jgi:LPS export ABC transporter protein LptC
MTNAKLLIVCVCLMIIGCTSDEVKQRVMNDRINLPLETGKNIYITYTDSGFTKAKVFAPLLERYANDTKNETIMNKGITAYFYNSKGGVDSYIKSKYAVRYDAEKRMIARNDVVLVSKKGDTLNTEELIWDERKSTISTDKFVKIITKDGITMGDGFESNLDFTKWRIINYRGEVIID